jgi:hypothetical protein
LSGADQGPVAGLDELLAGFSSSASPTWVNFLQSRTGLLLTFTPRSVVEWPTPLLNRTALNALLQSLSLCQLSETYENVACPN